MISIEKHWSSRSPLEGQKEIQEGIEEYKDEFGEKKSRPDREIQKEDNDSHKPNFHEWAQGELDPREILKMERKDREAALRALHRVLRMRYKGVGVLRQLLLAAVEKDHHVSREKLMDIVTGHAKRYALRKEMITKIGEMIDGWISWRNDLHTRYHSTDPNVIIFQAIAPNKREIRNIVESELAREEEELERNALSESSIGLVCTLGPYCMKIRMTSGEAKRRLSENGMRYGFFSLVTQAAFDLRDKCEWEPSGKDSPTLIHEEGHAIFHATQPWNKEEEIKRNEHEKVYFRRALHEARNEILARLRENKAKDSLVNIDGLKKLEYLMLYGGENRFASHIPKERWAWDIPDFSEDLLKRYPLNEKQVFGDPQSYPTFYMREEFSLKEKREYERIIVDALVAVRDLEKRHGVEQVIGMLQNESLREWPRIARRV